MEKDPTFPITKAVRGMLPVNKLRDARLLRLKVYVGSEHKFAAQKPVLDKALRTIPDALAVLSEQRENLVEAVDQFGKFSALTADTVNLTKENLVKELKDVGPVLESLANAGPALTRSLSFLGTYPWPKETVSNWVRGDYANLTAIIDLTLSRIDSSIFTATNPLVAPYHLDQGP